MKKEFLIELIFPAICIVFIINYIFDTNHLRTESIRFPYGVFLIAFTLIFIIIFKQYKIYTLTEKEKKEVKKYSLIDIIKRKKVKGPIKLLGMGVIYVILILQIGFLLSALLFLIVSMILLGVTIKKTFVTSIIGVVVVYLVFNLWLNLPLPEGILENIINKIL